MVGVIIILKHACVSVFWLINALIAVWLTTHIEDSGAIISHKHICTYVQSICGTVYVYIGNFPTVLNPHEFTWQSEVSV